MRPKLLILDGSAMISTAYYAVLPNEVKFAKTEEERKSISIRSCTHLTALTPMRFMEWCVR